MSNENSTLDTNEKSSHFLTNDTVRQWSANCGLRPNDGPFSTF